MHKRLEVPVVLIIFRRPEKSVQIVERIAQVRPSKMYIISDEGRTDAERCEVARCREMVEAAIAWDCRVVKDYALENKGVYDRIGLGALRVFEHEKRAIFLEDDNLPEISFFYYCEELLNRYEADSRVLWICGTNYLESCAFKSGADYGFTRHMLPCGWASWSGKFREYYDKDFRLFETTDKRKLRCSYPNQRLYRQDVRNWRMEIKRRKTRGRYFSWDYHMGFSLRALEKVGILPRYNQIENIGVDQVSEHGGTSFENVMTDRLCGMKSLPLSFPLIHPEAVECDESIERQLANVITEPLTFHTMQLHALGLIAKIVRIVLRIPDGVRTGDHLRLRRKKI